MRLPQSSLRNTLLLSHLGLVLLTMILVGLYVLDQMQGFYLQQLRQNLVVESTMVAAAAAEALSTTDLGPLREMMAAVDREGAVRIRVFDAAGRLIAATEVEDAPLVGEPLVATGLAAALRGERTTMLTNDAPGPEIMYLADPVVVDGQVRGAVRLAYALVDVSNEVATLRGALLVGLAGAGVGAAVLAVLLAGSLAAPARRLALAAQELAAGNLTTRCDATGSSEIAAAARAFDAMASRLQALQSARQELMATVAHDLNATTMA